MQALPHHYSVVVSSKPEGSVRLDGNDLPPLDTALPAQFGGTGDRWSPEALLVGAVADCLALTFRGITRARQIRWTSFRCDADGTLDRVEGALRFTAIDLHVHVSVPEGTNVHDVRRAIDRAEQTCLVTNSLKGDVRIHARVYVDEPVESPAFA